MIPIHRVGKPIGLRQAALDPGTRFASLPAFYANADGTVGRGKRQCTNEFKIEPVRSLLWKMHRAAGRPGIEQWFGISWDELERSGDSDAKYITNRYPLIDARQTRNDCLKWLAAHGWTAPRSACVGCPFHTDATWRHMRDHEPESWSEAVAFDKGIRNGHGRQGVTIAGQVFLHRSRVPLDEVDLRTVEEKGQGSLFELVEDTEGCMSGYCGR